MVARMTVHNGGNDMESFTYLISNDLVCKIVDDGLDHKGESGFWAKHTIIQNDVYNIVRIVHDMSLPLWLGVCQTGTHVNNYVTGESTFIPHGKGEYELIKEDIDYLYQHLGYTISSHPDVQ